jgi:N-acetylglucosaminyl-diphospho-decaprenol L-rhamnosyltransferase
MPDVAILVVNWNVRKLLRACLESVLADRASLPMESEIWVVDNASHDGSPEMIRADFSQVRLITNPDNLGFAAGNNVGLRQMAAENPPRYVLLLNPDAELRSGALRTLTTFMDQNPRAGVAGARLFYGDGSFQHSAFGFPGLWQIMADLYPLPPRLYETRLNGRYPRRCYERGKPFAIDHPLGAAMMVRWDSIQQVGLLDEEFHMYCEEIDWCMRIKETGYAIFCVPQAEVTHHEGQSTRQVQVNSYINLWRSRRRLYDKHYGAVKKRLAVQLVRWGMRYRIRTTVQEEKRGLLGSSEARSRTDAYSGALKSFK